MEPDSSQPLALASPDAQENIQQAPRSLHIENRHPMTLYLDVLRQTGSTDNWIRLTGEEIGKVTPDQPEHPIKHIETRIRGSMMHTEWEDVPGKPGTRRGVGEPIKEFNLETRFKLENHTYIDDAKTSALIRKFNDEGYEVSLQTHENGSRRLEIKTSAGNFELHIGFRDASDKVKSKYERMRQLQTEYPSLVPSIQGDIKEILEEKDKSEVSLEAKNSHPNLAPAGTPLPSKENFVAFVEEGKTLTEIIATALTEELKPKANFEQLQMEWKSQKIASALWHEKGRVSGPEDLLNLSMSDLNNSLVRVIQSMKQENNSPDLIDKTGIDIEVAKLLGNIEVYFSTKYGGKHLDLELLEEKERAILALGLALKCGEGVRASPDGVFLPKSTSSISGITFHRYGESQRDRFEFYQQQDRKFKYERTTAEAADFFLLHTTFEGQTDELTRYERIQSQNLEAARAWMIEELEPAKQGDYTVSDVQKLNSILLKGIIPERHLGRFRRTENASIKNRIGMTQPEDIEENLTRLLLSTKNYIREAQSREKDGEDKFKDEVIDKLAKQWACFDAIHPEEEGNGRTGTMLFESWYRVLLGNKDRFESPRNETWQLTKAMSKALRGDSDREFRYWDEKTQLDGDLKPLQDYIKSHLTVLDK